MRLKDLAGRFARGKEGKDAGGADEGAPGRRAQEAAGLTRVVGALLAVCVASVGFAVVSAAHAASVEGELSADTTPVVVAAATIEGGSTVAAADLKVVSVPRGYLVDGAVASAEASELVGQLAITDIAAGTQLTYALVAGEADTTTLARNLAPGMSAVTIATGTGTGLAGNLRQGDRVRVVSFVDDGECQEFCVTAFKFCRTSRILLLCRGRA